MGIDLICENKRFVCSYSYWTTILSDVLKATLEYLKDKFDLDQKNQNQDDIDSYYDIYKNQILNIKDINYSVINALNYFDVGGLFVLTNQSCYDGIYTIGNSLDICDLFDKIKPFMEKYNNTYESIYVKEGRFYDRLYDVFEESYQTKTKVIIC